MKASQLVESITSEVKQAAELYEEALDADCECDKANPGGHCPRCSKIERARSKMTKVIGEYEQK